MTILWAAIDEGMIKNVALGVTAGSVLVGLVLLKLIRSVVGRVVSTVFFAAIALAAFSQRQAIVDCIDKVRDEIGSSAVAGSNFDTTCTFFGRDVKLNVTP